MKKFDLDQLKRMLELADLLEAADLKDEADEQREMADAYVIKLSGALSLNKILSGITEKIQPNDPAMIALESVLEWAEEHTGFKSVNTPNE